MKFLFFGAHPDDVEMGCAGTILRLKEKGHWVGIIDLTHGEMGTRGSSETRLTESKNASELLGLDFRERLDLGDANIENTNSNRATIAQLIRKLQPDFIFMNAPEDRHIDHGYACQLVKDACFLSGLAKYENKENLKAHRPRNCFSYIQDHYLQPDFVVNITDVYDEKMKVIHSYETQFFQKEDDGPVTPISTSEFLEFFQGRATQMGRLIECRYGEGFIAHQPINAEDMGWF